MNTLVARYRHEQVRSRLVSRYAAKAPALDTNLAEAAAKKALARFNENKKTFEALKRLGDDVHSKKYSEGYGKLFHNGGEAVKAAREIVGKHEGDVATLKGRAKKNLEATLQWIDDRVRNWNYTKSDMMQVSREDRLSNVYAAAQQLEAALRGLPAVLQGKEEALDESWRES